MPLRSKYENEKNKAGRLDLKVINPAANAKHLYTDVHLHGHSVGADAAANGIVDALSKYRPDQRLASTRFVCVTAPWQFQTSFMVDIKNNPELDQIRGHIYTFAWYEYLTNRNGRNEDGMNSTTFVESLLELARVIDAEVELLKSSRTTDENQPDENASHFLLLSGISQGSGAAAHLCHNLPDGLELGGLYLGIGHILTQTEGMQIRKHIKEGGRVELACGKKDPIFPLFKANTDWVREGYKKLDKCGFKKSELEMRMDLEAGHSDDDVWLLDYVCNAIPNEFSIEEQIAFFELTKRKRYVETTPKVKFTDLITEDLYHVLEEKNTALNNLISQINQGEVEFSDSVESFRCGKDETEGWEELSYTKDDEKVLGNNIVLLFRYLVYLCKPYEGKRGAIGDSIPEFRKHARDVVKKHLKLADMHRILMSCIPDIMNSTKCGALKYNEPEFILLCLVALIRVRKKASKIVHLNP